MPAVQSTTQPSEVIVSDTEVHVHNYYKDTFKISTYYNSRRPRPLSRVPNNSDKLLIIGPKN